MPLRCAVFDWLSARTHDGATPISWTDIEDFTFRGERVPLKERQRGIWRPRVLPAALSFQTVYRRPDQPRPSADCIGPDGRYRCKWRGDDPDHPDNRAQRRAMEMRLPLIWLVGVDRGSYAPRFPIYLRGEELAQQFILDIDGLQQLPQLASGLEEMMRQYIERHTSSAAPTSVPDDGYARLRHALLHLRITPLGPARCRAHRQRPALAGWSLRAKRIVTMQDSPRGV